MKHVLNAIACLLIALIVLIVLCGIAFTAEGPDDIVRERVDLIEVNVLYDQEGRYHMAQTIFWEWRKDLLDYRVLDWRMMKSGDQWPQRQWSGGMGNGGYKVLWHDGQVLREVSAPAFRFTEGQLGVDGDPEVLDRDRFPKEQRAELRKP